jgi:hypothetical protein
MPKDKSLKRKRNRGQSIISYNKQDFFISFLTRGIIIKINRKMQKQENLERQIILGITK